MCESIQCLVINIILYIFWILRSKAFYDLLTVSITYLLSHGMDIDWDKEIHAKSIDIQGHRYFESIYIFYRHKSDSENLGCHPVTLQAELHIHCWLSYCHQQEKYSHFSLDLSYLKNKNRMVTISMLKDKLPCWIVCQSQLVRDWKQIEKLCGLKEIK